MLHSSTVKWKWIINQRCCVTVCDRFSQSSKNDILKNDSGGGDWNSLRGKGWPGCWISLYVYRLLGINVLCCVHLRRWELQDCKVLEVPIYSGGSRHSAEGANLICFLYIMFISWMEGGPKSIAKLDGGHGRICPLDLPLSIQIPSLQDNSLEILTPKTRP